MFASWFDPSTLITEPNVTDAVRREEDDDHAHLGGVPAYLRQENELHVGAEVAEDRGPSSPCPHDLDPAPEEPEQQGDQEDPSPTIVSVSTGWFVIASRSFPNWNSNEPATWVNR